MLELLSALVPSLLLSIPSLLVWIVGSMFALQFRHSQPNSTRLAIIGFVVLIVQTLIFTPLGSGLPMMLVQNGTPVGQVGLVLFGVSSLGQLIRAIGYGFLVAALLRAWRVNAGEGGAV